ncbi:MAG: hypothetical protein H6858_10260 [Rhodospirillales bacterium]|nr:hypothetical protein [Alphaproteobacteria bacterium]MCB9977969.1 hypothetical protein [Rhodospirillales bacterium]
MKPVFYILSTVVCVVLAGVAINPAINAISGSQAFAADDVVGVAEAQSTQKDVLSSQEDAVLDKLRSLLSENYCPNDEAKDWNGEEPAPACLLEQAKRVRIAVFGLPKFSKEEESAIQRVSEQEKKIKEIMDVYTCPPGVEEEWVGASVQLPAPKCVLVRSEKLQALRPDGTAFEVLDNGTSEKLNELKLLDFEISRLLWTRYFLTTSHKAHEVAFLQELKDLVH